MWERSFLAMSLLVGSTADEAIAALPDDAEARTADVTRALRDPSRAVRAQAIAAGAQDIARAIEEVALG